MQDSEKQVKEFLSSAKQSLNFLRIVLDDILYKIDSFTPDSQALIREAQESFKKHRAVLINIENLLKSPNPISEEFCNSLAKNLRRRISKIKQESIDLDKLR